LFQINSVLYSFITQFVDRFTVESSRLKNHDYSASGIYFITICTVHHNKFFGKINNLQMELSKMGDIAQDCLNEIPLHFPNIKILESVVMPNHVHILMELLKPIDNNQVETHRRDVACNVSTSKNNVSTNKNIFFSRISPKPNSISSIIRSFKSAVTRTINPHTIFFAWQPRFYDEIINDEKQYQIVKLYIKNNIQNWQKDKFYR